MPSRLASQAVGCGGRMPKRKRNDDGGACKNVASTITDATLRRIMAPPQSRNDEQDNLISSISLRHLLAPLEDGAFLRDCFRRCAVHVACGRCTSGPAADRVKLLRDELFDLDAGSILSSTSSESVFVWLRYSGSHSGCGSEADEDLIHSIEIQDPLAALALHKSGHATYCRAPPDLERLLVSTLLADTGLGCGQYDPSGESSTSFGRGEVEVFLGTTGHRTGWHWDFQENFTIQLSGSKKWTLQKGSVKHPLRGCTPHYRSPESVEPQLKAAHLGDPNFEFGLPESRTDAKQEEVVMKPGDALYFPAGMWHKVEVVEPGVSINVSLMATNYASITCQALQHVLLQKSEWRESIVNNTTEDVVAHLKNLLAKLPSIIEEFEREGGADCILPPAVRGPSNRFGTRGAATVSHEEDDSDDEDEEGENPSDLVDVTDETRSKGMPFRCTEKQLRDRFRSHRIIRNQLAMLLRESDVFKFYKTGDPSDDTSDAPREVYVLNVNYAGNESHESVLRVRILESGNLINHVFASAKSSGSTLDLLPEMESWIHSETERSMLGCLVYYGLLVWVPR